MYIDPGSLSGDTAEGTQHRLVATTMGNGEATFTWWNISQPMVALPESSWPTVADNFMHTWSMQTLSNDEALARVVAELGSMNADVAAVALQEEARARRFATAARVEGIIMWALNGASANQSYNAWQQTRHRVRKTDWEDLRLPAATPSNVRLASDGAKVAIDLFWLRWEAGVNLAQGRYGDTILRVTPEMSIFDVIKQTDD